ncbi:MAG: hypothetical protein JO080_10500 [Mucilaginibacter sp.]|nr:hypothetical protein [Mucilaginibacter sp.]
MFHNHLFSSAFFASISRLIAVALVNMANATIGNVKMDMVSKTWNFMPGTYNL